MNSCLISFFCCRLHHVVLWLKNGQKFDNLASILIGTLIGTKNGSQIRFFYVPKKLTLLDILEGNDATSLLMGMSSTMITYIHGS